MLGPGGRALQRHPWVREERPGSTQAAAPRLLGHQPDNCLILHRDRLEPVTSRPFTAQRAESLPASPSPPWGKERHQAQVCDEPSSATKSAPRHWGCQAGRHNHALRSPRPLLRWRHSRRQFLLICLKTFLLLYPFFHALLTQLLLRGKNHKLLLCKQEDCLQMLPVRNSAYFLEAPTFGNV